MPVTVAGIDVGGVKKGFHAVALRGPRILDCFASTDPEAMAAWCVHLGARAVGVDAPAAWSADGRARPAERALACAAVRCFASPTRAAAVAHPANWYGWMLAGEALYRALGPHFARLDGRVDPPARPFVFETFPQGIACAMAGRPVSARDKVRVRRRILRKAGIDPAPLANIDLVDAALCALAAQHATAGCMRLYGEAGSGFIAMPLGAGAIDARLVRAYRAARYVVDEGAGALLVLRVDCASPGLLALFQRHRVREAAFITACNPGSRVLSDAANRRRMGVLARELAALGHPAIAGRGEDASGAWQAEASFLVPGLTEPEARALATRHGQNAVLHARRDGVPRLVLVR